MSSSDLRDITKGATPSAIPALGSQAFGEPVQVFAAPPGTPAKARIARADGLRLWDTTGRCYLDASSGPVAYNLGYGNRRVLDAMHTQAEAAAFANVSHFESAANRDFADLLAETAGPGFERVFIVSGGSEAIEAALKLARQIAVSRGERQRWKVISRQPSYHGSTLGALSVTGDPAAHDMFGPMMSDMPKVPAPKSLRLPRGQTRESWGEVCADALEQQILHQGPETVLAFLQEPVGGLATGALVPPESYMRRVREICDRYGILLIHDEVMSGGGRTGDFLAHDHWTDCKPDLVVMAKGVGAGYFPLGLVLAGREDVARVAERGGFMHGHTAYASPLACAVGLAVLQETLENNLVKRAEVLGKRLRAGMDRIAQRLPIVGEVRGKGMLMAIELVAEPDEKRSFPIAAQAGAVLSKAALDLDLILYQRRTNGGRDGDWVMLTPPLVASEADIDEILEKTEQALERASEALGVL
jgi:adenosylmethionine-8-amino-7-oxononanoate aminotransferase